MQASWQARVAAFVVRRHVKQALADMRSIAAVRQAFGGKALPAAKGVRYTAATWGGVAGEWVEAEATVATPGSPATTLLYLHGGGFVGCSAQTHRPLTAAFALQGLRVFVPDYRLAPEHPFPAAPQDALAVYRALRAAAPAGRLVVAGRRWRQPGAGPDADAARRWRGPARRRCAVLAGAGHDRRQPVDDAQRHP